MSSGVTLSYYASQYLLANANRTRLTGAGSDQSLTAWLKDAYNANIGESTDFYELLSQLKSNSAFNPLDSIDDYVLNLENSPLGNMTNDGDHDYNMYTIGIENSNSSSVILQSHLPDRNGYSVHQNAAGVDLYFKSEEDKTLKNDISTGGAPKGSIVRFMRKDGTNDYSYIELSSSSPVSAYADGVSFDSNGYIAPKGTDLKTDINTFITNNGQINGVTIKNASKDQLIAMYKQLTTEMQGLKEYTLTNQEILDLKADIDNLTGDGVQGNLQRKIANAQDELKQVFSTQATRLSDNTVTGINSIFKVGDISKLSGVALLTQVPIESVGTLAYDVYGIKFYSYNGQLAKAGTQVTKSTVTNPDGASLNQLFGQDGNGNYNFVNNPFYQYEVALRTDNDLSFEKSFAQSLPEWISAEDPIKKVDNVFDPSKYSNIKDKDPKLGTIDILKNLYGTQELLALYKQYEESQNKANSMMLGLNLALQNSAEFDFRKALSEQILTTLKGLDPMVSVTMSNQISINNSLQRGCSTGPSAIKGSGLSTPKFDGYYGDVLSERKTVKDGTSGTVLVDPYLVTINGVQYVMGKDNNQDGNIDDVSEILGITDSQENPFMSLIELDANKDGKVSQAEMLNSGIVFKAVDSSGKLTTSSYDTSLVSGIDLSTLDKTQSGNVSGSFIMKLSNGASVKGVQTFDDQSYFNKLFGGLVDLTKYQKAASTSTTTASTNTTSGATTTPTSTSSTSSTNLSHQKLLSQLNSAYSALIIDDTSNIETIMNNVCWKHNVTLTSAQRIKIIDGIDPLLSPYEIEKKIVNAVSQLNIAA